MHSQKAATEKRHSLNIIDIFRDSFAQFPEVLQPLVIAAAAAVPFIEGEGAAVIGVLGGVHPAAAISAAILGNFICVTILTYASAHARDSATKSLASRRANSRETDEDRDAVLDCALDPAEALETEVLESKRSAEERRAARWVKFRRAFERYGVPGVSLLGPLLMPNQFTAAMLAASGIRRVRVLFWQALSIIGWTVTIGLLGTGVISAFQ